ncbi:MAG: KH domain-containing protein [Deltaproteobacteria bacterium]|nr:KH domain-containing protein [Deltaproteobacteria bacterium]
MDFVESEGDSIDAAIENALQQLGVQRDKVTVDIISEGRKGIFGFGAQKAKVRAELRTKSVAPKAPAVPALERRREEELPQAVLAEPAAPVDQSAAIEKTRAVLCEILKRMGIAATVEQKSAANGAEIILEIKTEESGLLIGRKGQTLEALQYLVERIAGERQSGEGAQIIIDIENYRERRRRSLEDMALRLGEKAKRQRKTVTVDALDAADRRVVHAALQDDPWLTTRSLGQGPYRRLLIIPEGDRKIKNQAAPGAQEPRDGRPQREAPKAAAPQEPDEES